jgi:hypothetical protein
MLTDTYLVTVAEIVQETFDTVESLASSLNAKQEESIVADVTLWGTIRNSHVKLDKEVNFDNERKREAIRRRVRTMLGLPMVSSQVSGYSVSIPHVWIF